MLSGSIHSLEIIYYLFYVMSSQILSVLRNTASFLPRVLPAQSLQPCSDLLLNAYQDISSTAPRSTRVAVYAADQSSAAQDLVTALLQDPLTSDQSQNDRIRTRWQTHVSHHPLTIS